ncbi:hypothetical protein [Providencia phage vB_PreS-PatoteraRojo]|nr:hypothetical protein [Providencia phage vB_PreS-PatoteraRojo]
MSTKVEYQELRKVYQDKAVEKGRLMLGFIETISGDVSKYSQKMMADEMAMGFRENYVEHDKIGDQYAESIADLRKAQESMETAIFYIVKALHHGNAMDLLNLEAE